MEMKTAMRAVAHGLSGIFARLLLVVLVIVVPVFIGFAFLINHFCEREQVRLLRDTLMTARAMVLAVDRDLASCKSAALALASSGNPELNELGAFHAHAGKLLNAEFPGFNFVLSDVAEKQLFNTLLPFGSRLPRVGNPAAQRKVMETGQPVVSDLYVGGVLERLMVSVGVPVWRNGKVVYALSVGILPERLGRVLTEQRLPPNRIAALLDTQGTIIARTHDPQKYVGRKAMPSFFKHIEQFQEGEVESVTLDAIPVYSVYSRSPVSGWSVVIGVPKQAVLSELMASVYPVSALMLVLLVPGLALAWYLSSGINRSIRALAAPDALSADLRLPRLAFREARDVAAELLRHRRHLEQLVCERTRQLELSSQSLAESQRMTRAVIDAMPGLVAYWDVELRCRFANKNYLEWFGKSLQDMIGIRLQDLLGVELFALNEPYLRRALAGELQHFERTLTKVSGAICQTWASYIPDRDAEGNVPGIFVVVTDVTALKKAEEDQRIAAAAFNIHEAMLITDANVLVLRVNPAYTEETGFAPEEVVGKMPQLFQPDLHDPACFAQMWECLHRCGSWQGELRDRRKNGEIYPIWFTITGVIDPDGRTTHFVCTQTDITVRKAAEEEIRNMAYFDALTGLPNRRMMMDRLRQSLASCHCDGHQGALMFIDIDNFKQINDTLGHDQGDALLQQAGLRLLQHALPGSTVARLGGDEFVVLLEKLGNDPASAQAQATCVGEKILAALSQPYLLNGCNHQCTASIGMTMFGKQRESISTLLKHADQAMYQVKIGGRNGLHLFQTPDGENPANISR